MTQESLAFIQRQSPPQLGCVRTQRADYVPPILITGPATPHFRTQRTQVAASRVAHRCRKCSTIDAPLQRT